MDKHAKARELVSQMTLEEKASLCSGKDFWNMKGIERFGLPEIMLTDGPHGLRKQEAAADHLGLNESVPATCFPTASATACSFDQDLLFEMGSTYAEECEQENVAVALGPGINMKRSPLCGRNFEYFSEDPFLAGEIAAGFIQGMQSKNVGVSVKHYLANNQEKGRMVSESVVDERTIREIYLKAFEIAVKKSSPWTVMASYNRLQGEYVHLSRKYLTDILRGEWGFDGVVVSDWGAVSDRVKALQAGLDLEMPSIGKINDQRIVDAVRNGSLDESNVDEAAVRVTELILKSMERKPGHYDPAKHHAVARKIASESAVLLKNEGNILPGKISDKAAVIGAFARSPRYQGTGSSKINPTRMDSPLDELIALGLDAEYAAGYALASDSIDETLIVEACKVAAGKDMVYLFAGLPDRYESESFDRSSMKMPENHIKLIEAVSAVNSNLVVVLMGGSPMELPWADKAKAILLMYLGGQAAGGACADLLLGKVNPSGKLAESWPVKLEDNPSYNYFPGYDLSVEYREGPFIGYRYYDKAGKAVRYPFGFGLSYTQFEYSDLQVPSSNLTEKDQLIVTFKVKNIGTRAGKEVVQLYIACKNSVIIRPEQELKEFAKISLEPGETKEVSFKLGVQELAYYNVEGSCWHVESGNYEVRVSASSRDTRLVETVHVENSISIPLPDLHEELPCYYDLSNGIKVSDNEFEALLGNPLPKRKKDPREPFTINTRMADTQSKLLGKILMKSIRDGINKMGDDNADIKLMAENMIMDAPIRLLSMMGGTPLTTIEGLVEMLNGHYVKGIKLINQK